MPIYAIAFSLTAIKTTLACHAEERSICAFRCEKRWLTVIALTTFILSQPTDPSCVGMTSQSLSYSTGIKEPKINKVFSSQSEGSHVYRRVLLMVSPTRRVPCLTFDSSSQGKPHSVSYKHATLQVNLPPHKLIQSSPLENHSINDNSPPSSPAMLPSRHPTATKLACLLPHRQSPASCTR